MAWRGAFARSTICFIRILHRFFKGRSRSAGRFPNFPSLCERAGAFYLAWAIHPCYFIDSFATGGGAMKTQGNLTKHGCFVQRIITNEVK